MSGTQPATVWQLRWRRLRADRAALLGAGVLLLLGVAAASVGLFEAGLGVSGVETDLLGRFDPPSATHWLGTDDAGRDVVARLLRGGAVSLAVGLLGAVSASLIGTLVGATAGYLRGWVDAVLMRFTDFVIGLPWLPMLIILAALDLGKLGLPAAFVRSGSANFWRIVAIFALLSWTGVARLARAGTLALAEREFVEAARAQGASPWRILRVHILPNAISPVIIATTLAMGRIVLAESGLSFLGVGIQPPQTSWGGMLNNALDLIGTAPALAVYPGVMILVTVVAINFLGDGLQAAFDPGGLRRQEGK
jgi:peptide/nickel transport system permease protein